MRVRVEFEAGQALARDRLAPADLAAHLCADGVGLAGQHEPEASSANMNGMPPVTILCAV